jgi:hypothetical protein
MSVKRKGLGEAGEGDLRSTFEYRVLSASPGSLHVKLERETRLDASGRPVTWHLVVFGRDTLRWHRSDWREGAYTPELVRCEI